MKERKRKPEPTMTILEASKRLGLCYLTTLKMARTGKIPTLRLGGRKFLVLREQFEAMFRKPQRKKAINA
jgi:excisionase family DNA binding protein